MIESGSSWAPWSRRGSRSGSIRCCFHPDGQVSAPMLEEELRVVEVVRVFLVERGWVESERREADGKKGKGFGGPWATRGKVAGWLLRPGSKDGRTVVVGSSLGGRIGS